MKRLAEFIARFSNELSIALVLVIFFCHHGFFSNPKSELIKSDGFGYYSYLPAKFIYHDPSYTFLEKYHKENYESTGLQGFTNEVNGRKVNKYFIGVSVLLLPFFFLAHWLSMAFGFAPDGYSLLYQYFTGLGAIFYLWFGCRYCSRLMRMYGISQGTTAMVIPALVFGTLLFHYTVFEPSMSHVYSFAAISGFLYFTKKATLEHEGRHYFLAFIALGFIVLLRPVNILVVLAIPFLAGNKTVLLQTIFAFFKRKRTLFISVLGFALLVSIQLLAWHKQTGSALLWSYSGEGFYFSDPHIFGALFSYKKGLFVYTPIAFLALVGFFFLRKRLFELTSLFLFLLITVYVISSWHDWSYGMSFGYRPLTDHFAFVALLAGFAFQLLTPLILKGAYALLLLACIGLNQVQDFQYRHYILHWSIMSETKYWKVFLKTGDRFKGYLWDQMYYEDVHGNLLSSHTTDLESKKDPWEVPKPFSAGTAAHSGSQVSLTDSTNEYGATLVVKSGSIINKTGESYVRVKLWKYAEASDTGAFLVISIDSANGKNYSYWTIPFEKISWHKTSQWEEVRFGAPLKGHGDPDDIIKVYVWNPTRERLLLDDITVEFFR